MRISNVGRGVILVFWLKCLFYILLLLRIWDMKKIIVKIFW